MAARRNTNTEEIAGDMYIRKQWKREQPLGGAGSNNSNSNLTLWEKLFSYIYSVGARGTPHALPFRFPFHDVCSRSKVLFSLFSDLGLPWCVCDIGFMGGWAEKPLARSLTHSLSLYWLGASRSEILKLRRRTQSQPAREHPPPAYHQLFDN
jgi:hypothetical protein